MFCDMTFVGLPSTTKIGNQEELEFMKIFLWVVFGLLVTGLAFWILTMPGVPHNPVLMFLIIVVFVVSPFGSFWMLYMSVRHERRPLPMVLLAFIPYTFLWYYFERVRLRRGSRNDREGELW